MTAFTLPLTEPIATAYQQLSGATDPDVQVPIQDGSQTYTLWLASLRAMVTMGLGDWPISAIAVPASLASRFYQRQPVTRDLGNARLAVLPSEVTQCLDTMGQHLKALNTAAYSIGGLVRDTVIAIDATQSTVIDSPDVDITVEGQAIDTAKALQAAWPALTILDTFDAYGTVRAQVASQRLDMASTRVESYQAVGAMPTVDKMGVPLADDLMRRDFTVNTLALAVHEPGLVRDSLGGLADLYSAQLRLLTPHSCYEDPSRIMRAFKYAMRLNFQWSDDTLYLIEQSLRHLADYSSLARPAFDGGGERVRIEWHECLALPESPVKTQWIQRFFDVGAWRVMLPSLPASAQPVVPLDSFAQALTKTAETLAQSEVGVADLYWLICLLSMPDTQRTLAMTRLGCRKPLVDAVAHCHAYRTLRPNPFDSGLTVSDPVGIVELCSTLPPLSLWFLALTSQDVLASAGIISVFTESLAFIQPELTGRELAAMGVSPGPRMGELLKGLLHAKLLGNLVTESDERDWIQRQLSDSPN